MVGKDMYEDKIALKIERKKKKENREIEKKRVKQIRGRYSAPNLRRQNIKMEIDVGRSVLYGRNKDVKVLERRRHKRELRSID